MIHIFLIFSIIGLVFTGSSGILSEVSASQLRNNKYDLYELDIQELLKELDVDDLDELSLEGIDKEQLLDTVQDLLNGEDVDDLELGHACYNTISECYGTRSRIVVSTHNNP